MLPHRGSLQGQSDGALTNVLGDTALGLSDGVLIINQPDGHRGHNHKVRVAHHEDWRQGDMFGNLNVDRTQPSFGRRDECKINKISPLPAARPDRVTVSQMLLL